MVLDADVARAFPDSAAVNEALRVIIKAGKNARGEPARSVRKRVKVARAR